MKRNDIIGEHKKGVRAIKYNKKPTTHSEPPKPRNPVAKNANAAIGGGAAGAHKDKKKAAKQGEVKHKKPAELAEVSLKGFGTYAKKAQMDKALSQMGSAFAPSPEERAKNLAKAARREKGLARHKTRVDKHWAEKNARDAADREQAIRNKYSGVDIDAEIAKLQPALKRAYHDYQYGARNTYSDARDEYQRIGARIQELERAKKVLGGDIDEEAPIAGKVSQVTAKDVTIDDPTQGIKITAPINRLVKDATGKLTLAKPAASAATGATGTQGQQQDKIQAGQPVSIMPDATQESAFNEVSTTVPSKMPIKPPAQVKPATKPNEVGQTIKSAGFPNLEPINVPPMPTDENGQLGDAERLDSLPNGNFKYYGGFGAYTYDKTGKPLTYQTPSFAGLSQTNDLVNGNITIRYAAGPLDVSAKFDKTGKPLDSMQAQYNLGLGVLGIGKDNGITTKSWTAHGPSEEDPITQKDMYAMGNKDKEATYDRAMRQVGSNESLDAMLRIAGLR